MLGEGKMAKTRVVRAGLDPKGQVPQMPLDLEAEGMTPKLGMAARRAPHLRPSKGASKGPKRSMKRVTVAVLARTCSPGLKGT